MKKLTMLLAALLVLLVAGPGFAQNWSGGVKGGLGFSNLGGDIEDLDSSLGFSVGGFLGTSLHEYFAVDVLAQYVQKGAEESVDGGDLEFNLDYIEILVPATLTIPIQDSPITPRIYAGPALAFEITCELSASGGGVSADADCDQLFEATDGLIDDLETKSVDFGVFFGGGVDFMVGNGALTLDLLYNLGLTNVNDTPDDPTDVKNKNLQILAGYKFFFGS